MCIRDPLFANLVAFNTFSEDTVVQCLELADNLTCIVCVCSQVSVSVRR